MLFGFHEITLSANRKAGRSLNAELQSNFNAKFLIDKLIPKTKSIKKGKRIAMHKRAKGRFNNSTKNKPLNCEVNGKRNSV